MVVILVPFTKYKLWLKAFTWKNEGSPSQQLSLTTDVSGPASPVITNLTCADATTLHLEWFSRVYWTYQDVWNRIFDIFRD